LNDIHLLTEGQSGRAADVARCDEILQLGERYGIAPLPLAEEDAAADADLLTGRS
jgi:hypothetical protein